MKFEIIFTELEDRDLKTIEEHGTIKIPDVVTTIADDAFWGLYTLEKITLPKNIKKIGKNAFADCQNLHTVTLSENLEDIDYTAFSGCYNLKTINVPIKILEKIGNIKSYFNENTQLNFIRTENELIK